MRVLVTRTQSASRKTAERLAALGHEPVILPLAQAEHHPDAVLSALARPHAALAITSAEALKACPADGRVLQPHLETPLFAVGAATATAARALGFSNVRSADGDGEALSACIAQAAIDWSKPLLYLAGHPRKASLEQGLARHDIPAVTVEAYRMQPIDYSSEEIIEQLAGKGIDAVLLYSAETARRLFALPVQAELANLFAAAQFFCLSRDIAEKVPEPFSHKVSIAPRPDEDGLFSLL